MIKLTNYDLRQIKLMEQKIALFNEGKIELRELISDLEGILCALESVEESWKEEVRAEINDLELRVFLDGIEGASKSILEIKNINSLLLKDYLSSSDLSVEEHSEILDHHWLMCSKCTEAWESTSMDAMVICPSCNSTFHNPRIIEINS